MNILKTYPGFARAAVMAAVLSGASGLAQAQERTPHQHRRAAIRTLRLDGTADAYNWSGYAVAASTPPPAPGTAPTGVTVTSVSGSWVVPKATCTGRSTQYAAFWIGIDGWYSPTVEQIGTDSDCSSGTPQYYAWYEFYPLDSYYACPTAKGRNQPACALKDLSPGDTMTASVVYNSNGTFTATIEDVTKGSSTTFSTIYTPNRETGTPQLSSAEWIAEAPCCTNSGGTLPLSDFGTVAFQSADAVVNGSASSPVGFFYSDAPATWWECTMVIQSYPIPDGGVNPPAPPTADIMAEPATLLDNGSAFDINWLRVRKTDLATLCQRRLGRLIEFRLRRGFFGFRDHLGPNPKPAGESGQRPIPADLPLTVGSGIFHAVHPDVCLGPGSLTGFAVEPAVDYKRGDIVHAIAPDHAIGREHQTQPHAVFRAPISIEIITSPGA